MTVCHNLLVGVCPPLAGPQHSDVMGVWKEEAGPSCDRFKYMGERGRMIFGG